jgi:hypothetical protein
MLGLQNLGRNTKANVARLLYTTVDVDIAVVDDEHQEARRGLVTVTSLVPDLSD